MILVVPVFAESGAQAEFVASDTGGRICVPTLGGASPGDGATAVVLDVVPAVEVRNFVECGSPTWELELFDGTGLLASGERTPDLGLVEFTPARDLDPDTRYRLDVTDLSGFGTTESFAFTTGDALFAGEPWSPELKGLTARWAEGAGRLDVTVTAEIPLGLPDFTGLRTGMADDETGAGVSWELALLGFGGADTVLGFRDFPDEDPGRICVGVAGRNVNGSWTETVGRCADTTPAETDEGGDGRAACMCAPAGRPEAGWVAAMASLLTALRRRATRAHRR
jgi:hypothetical protein